MTRLTLALAILGGLTIVPATAFAMGPYLPQSLPMPWDWG